MSMAIGFAIIALGSLMALASRFVFDGQNAVTARAASLSFCIIGFIVILGALMLRAATA